MKRLFTFSLPSVLISGTVAAHDRFGTVTVRHLSRPFDGHNVIASDRLGPHFHATIRIENICVAAR